MPLHLSSPLVRPLRARRPTGQLAALIALTAVLAACDNPALAAGHATTLAVTCALFWSTLHLKRERPPKPGEPPRKDEPPKPDEPPRD